MRGSLFWLLVTACAEDGPSVSPHPCASDEMRVEVAPPDGDFGDLDAGGPFWVGDPPQGGAPYSPFRIRLSGPEVLFDGVDVDVVVTEGDAIVAENTIPKGLTCANVGENAGFWVGSEVHLRYYGLDKAELHGRGVDVEVTVTGGENGEWIAVERGFVTLSLD